MEIFAAELNPYDSLRCRKKDSDINRNIIWLILKENKLKPYKMSVHQSLTHDDFEQRLALYNWIRKQSDFHLKILFSVFMNIQK